MSQTLSVRIPKQEVDLWIKARGNRKWKEIVETGLFGDHKPFDVVTYDEMQAYVDQKIAEALAKK